MHYEQMVHNIYPTEHKLNKANASNSEAAFLEWNISIKNESVSQKIYVDFDFDIADFPFLDGDVPRSPSNGVYIFQLVCFARASSHVSAETLLWC